MLISCVQREIQKTLARGAANSGIPLSVANLGVANLGVANSGVANSGVANSGAANLGVANSKGPLW